MAAPAGSNDSFDMHQQIETWANFQRLAKWLGGGTIVLLILMAIFLV